MKSKELTSAIRDIIISLNCISGFVLACTLSIIAYDCYCYGIGIVLVLMAPVALISFMVLVITSAYAEKKDWNLSRLGNKIFAITFFPFTISSIGYKMWLDSPAVVLHASYDGRHTINLYLREDMTVKSEEIHMLGTNESYGDYHIDGDMLVLKNINIKYCGSVFVDTLFFEEDYLKFLVADNKCSIKNTRMHIFTNNLKSN